MQRLRRIALAPPRTLDLQSAPRGEHVVMRLNASGACIVLSVDHREGARLTDFSGSAADTLESDQANNLTVNHFV